MNNTYEGNRVGAATVRRVDDQREWDEVGQALDGHLLQSWAWGEFKRCHSWEPVRLLVDVNGSPDIAAQILIRTFGPFSIIYVPRGPSWGNPPDIAMATVTTAIDRLASSRRAVLSLLEPDRDSINGLSISGNLGWRGSPLEIQPQRTIKVPIDRSDDELLEGMKSKTRYNVRLAKRRGVTVRIAHPSEVTTFYELLEETHERDGFGIHGIEYYADLLEVFGDRSALFIAEFEGVPAAAAIVVRHHGEAIYMFGSSARQFQRHMPSHLVQFEAMRWARDLGCTAYDLWGIPTHDEPPPDAAAAKDSMNVRSGLWGVFRFKQGFGGAVVTYPGMWERVYYPGLVALWRRLGLGIA